MKNLEGNKIAAAILLAGLIAMGSGKIADILYHPAQAESSDKRGFQVEVAPEQGEGDSASSAEAAKPIDIKALLAAANAEAGASKFKQCGSCHTADKGGKNRVGPNLYGIIGRARASHEGFNYSDAMKAKGGSWDYNDLFTFIHKPKDVVPSTKMTFPGVKKPEDAADIVAYLRTLSDSPKPLP